VFKIAPGEQNLVAAGQAFQPDVGAQAHYFPLIPAAGMGFAHFDDVIEMVFDWHV